MLICSIISMLSLCVNTVSCKLGWEIWGQLLDWDHQPQELKGPGARHWEGLGPEGQLLNRVNPAVGETHAECEYPYIFNLCWLGKRKKMGPSMLTLLM